MHEDRGVRRDIATRQTNLDIGQLRASEREDRVLVADHPSVAAPVLALRPAGDRRVQPERLADDGVEVRHVCVVLGVERVGLWRVVRVDLCAEALVHLRALEQAKEDRAEDARGRVGAGDHREDPVGHDLVEGRRGGGLDSGLVVLRCI